MTGKELQALRQAHNLTQKTLGMLLGYDANYIARLEREAVEHGKRLTITTRFEKLLRSLLPIKKNRSSPLDYP